MIAEAVDRAVTAVLRDPRSAATTAASRPPVTGPPAPPRDDGGGTSCGDPTMRCSGGAPPGSIADLGAQLAAGERTADDLVRRAWARAARRPGILLRPDSAAARFGSTPAAQRTNSSGPLRKAAPDGVLAGIPIAVKDNIDVAGMPTGMGGPTGRHRANSDAAVVRRLRAAGAEVLAHAAMRELAWGVTTPGCPNPWRPGLDTGGSSGGAAAAVAAGIVPVAIGTDTGGSIRIPAALCGVTGLRPTHGAAALAGVAAMAPDLDTVGPLALCAADCLLMHELIAGIGGPPSGPPAGQVVGLPVAPMAGQVVGLPVAPMAGQVVGLLSGWQGRVHPAVQQAVDDAAAALAGAGARIVPVDLGSAGLASCAAYVLMLVSSARLYLAEAERHGDAVDGEVLEQLRQGARIDRNPAVYPAAQSLAAGIRRDVLRAFADLQLAAVLGPVTAVPAVPAGATQVAAGDRSQPVADALSRYTATASVTGLPALSLPAGLHEGLPVGVQLLGPAHGERTLAALAGPIERGPGAVVAAARRALWG